MWYKNKKRKRIRHRKGQRKEERERLSGSSMVEVHVIIEETLHIGTSEWLPGVGE